MPHKKADRRPEWMPGAGFCCRSCQEGHQLQCVATETTAPAQTRQLAAEFLAWFNSIHQGRYGGVEIANLFD